MTTRTNLNQIASQHFDVVVIGAGINGAAGAHRLVADGYKVLLVDKGDFGSGTSSRSSRLLHCGLRYLAPGRSPWEFVFHPGRFAVSLKMARQAVIARDNFIKTTPNRTQLIKLFFPIYQDSQYSGWQIDAAFKILDGFNHGRTPLGYKRLKRDQAREVPLIRGLRDFDRLSGVATYDEYQIAWPERVTVDLAMDAQASGAVVLNYVEAQIAEKSGENWVVNLNDKTDGTCCAITASSVITTGGIWIDRILGKHRAGKPPKILGTKGVHIAVRLPRECKGYGIATLNRKNQPFYCLPWGDLHYIGPTETLYEGDLDRVTPLQEERDWLLAEANHLLPALRLTARDVVFSWAGVRPLTWDPELPMGNRNRVLHDLSADGLSNVFALTGGPVMTHRSAGEEIAQAIQKTLGPRGTPRNLSFASKFPSPFEVDMLKELTGATAPAWVKNMLKSEHIVHLSDVILRRAGLAWMTKLGPEQIAMMGRMIGKEAGWGEKKTEEEIAAAIAELSMLQM